MSCLTHGGSARVCVNAGFGGVDPTQDSLTRRGPAWDGRTRSQLRVLPGPVLTSFFCCCWARAGERGCVAAWPHAPARAAVEQCPTVPSVSLCPTVRLQLPDGAERGGPPAAQPHQVPASPAVLRGAAGAGAGVCVHTTERDAAPGPSRQTSARPAIAARPALHHLLLHTLLHALGLRNSSAADTPPPPRCCGRLST